MKKFSNTMLACVLVAFGLLGGCALFGGVAEKVAEGIEKYCEEPYSQRLVYHEHVNKELLAAGHSVDIICAGDPEDIDDATSNLEQIQTKPAPDWPASGVRSHAVPVPYIYAPLTSAYSATSEVKLWQRENS